MGRLSWPPAFPPSLYTHLLVEVRVGTPTSTKRGLSGRLPWQFRLLPLAVIITAEVSYCFSPRPGAHYPSQEKNGAAAASEMTPVTAGQLLGGTNKQRGI